MTLGDILERQLKLGDERKGTYRELGFLIQQGLFDPNAVTARISRALDKEDIYERDVAGTGAGVFPLEIFAALNGANHVYGVEPHPGHIALAYENIRRHGVQDFVTPLQGHNLDPLIKAGIRVDTLISDASGIARTAGIAAGWYSEDVQTADESGIDIALKILEQAPAVMRPGAVFYFPLTPDLADGERLRAQAKSRFDSVQTVLEFPMFFSQEEFVRIQDAYQGVLPSFMDLEKRGSKHQWHGEVIKAQGPR